MRRSPQQGFFLSDLTENFIVSGFFFKARARLEMREKASQQDAQDVVEIMKYSLLDTFSDDFGNLDFQRSQHGSGMSSRAQVGQLTYPT